MPAQDELEAILEEHLGSSPAVRVEHGVEVVDVDSHADWAEVTLRDASGTRSIRARYLVAADGIRSTVRTALGIPTHGPGHLADRLGIVFRAPLWELLGEHRHVIYLLGHDGMTAAIPVGRPDRWMYARTWDPERERIPDLTPEDVARELRLATGVPDLEPQIEHVSHINYGVAVAERFRARSAFLIGDSARHRGGWYAGECPANRRPATVVAQT